jgi:DNA modification methylase
LKSNKRFGNQKQAKILHGHALDQLEKLPDESVHTIITSPPYWGLRRYGTSPQVWPGAAPPCQGDHEWVGERWRHASPVRGRSEERFSRGHQPKEINQLEGAFCRRCDAWRGELGLEPTPELYVQHLVEIFREARRVLRSDGTLWLNLGDSYWGGKGASGAGSRDYFEQRKDKSLARTAQHVGEKGSIKPGDGRHATIKSKDLVGIPWMAAFALRDDGWTLRSDIIWHKTSCVPESIRDRPTRAHEYLFLLSKQRRYFFDHIAFREPSTSGPADLKRQRDRRPRAGGKYSLGPAKMKEQTNAASMRKSGTVGTPGWRNRRSVWSLATSGFRGQHFATFPVKLIEPCILAGTSEKGCCAECGAPYVRFLPRSKQPADKWVASCFCNAGAPVPCTVLDLFNGAATTGVGALTHGRNYIGIELNADYIRISEERLAAAADG